MLLNRNNPRQFITILSTKVEKQQLTLKCFKFQFLFEKQKHLRFYLMFEYVISKGIHYLQWQNNFILGQILSVKNISTLVI